MKFMDLALSGHGTDFVTKRTHPCGVWYTSRECGVGNSGSLRVGGVNTDANNNPVSAPINTQSKENIILSR